MALSQRDKYGRPLDNFGFPVGDANSPMNSRLRMGGASSNVPTKGIAIGGAAGGTPVSSSVTPVSAPSQYTLSPTPTTGNGPFGAVPGQLGLPDPAANLAAQVPGLSNINSAASGNILSQLQGKLSPGTINALQNFSAERGVASGMPGAPLNWNALYGNIAGASEALQTQGLQNYNSFIPTVSGTQTVSPALQNEIAQQNALNAAAPDPSAAASYSAQMFDKYLAALRGPGGGTMGGRGGGGFDMSSIPQIANPIPQRRTGSTGTTGTTNQTPSGQGWGILESGGQYTTVGNPPASALPSFAGSWSSGASDEPYGPPPPPQSGTGLSWDDIWEVY
jgi:hypothetical protein